VSLQLSSLIIDYAKSLPAWQKILAHAAFKHEGDLSQAKEIDASISRFLKDQKPPLSDKDTGGEEIAYIDALIAAKTLGNAVIPRLVEISEYKNVNALSNGQKITFAPKLTIIYGENGSGKSGYSRVLNKAFYSRGDKEILPNILKPENEHGSPSAKFEFEVSGQRITKLFPADLASPEFKQFACFDSITVPAHLEGSNELYVIPKEMEFFDRLSQLIGIVEKRLKDKIAQLIKPNEFSNYFDGESALKDEVKAINANTDYFKLSAVGLDRSNLEKELEVAEKQYHELKGTDQKKAVAELKLAVSECESYAEALAHVLEKCNEDSVENIRDTIDKLKQAESAVAKSGAESFKTGLLETVGSEKWRQFIVSASALTQGEGAHRGRAFPMDGDACPLCLQRLESDALALFDRYFDFLRGQAEKDLKTAKEALKNLDIIYHANNLSALSSKQNLSKWLEANRQQDKTDLAALDELIRAFFAQAKDRIASFDLNPLTPIRASDSKVRLVAIKAAIEEAIKAFDEANFSKTLMERSKAVTLLKHKLKFLEIASDIEKFIKNQKWASDATAAVKSISSRPITEKGKKLFNDYFTKEYQQTFFREAQKLHVRFKIDVKSEGKAGKNLRKLDVSSYSPADVLSEGEQRAIALADFLTEIEICNLRGGIIFDDPVNSLDHKRKSDIAKRLVEESARRQVVIFTHDISFLFDLVNEAERQRLKEKQDFFCHWIEALEERVGLVSLNHKKDLEMDYKRPTRAEEYWGRAKAATSPDERERLSQEGFNSLRKTYEAFILDQLFGGTVKRFDRQIKYATLKEAYCPKEDAEFVCDRLAYCSGFVSAHLHADGYSGPSASPELLKREIDAYIKFRKDYEGRKKDYLKAATTTAAAGAQA
jgi:energy-coupling factor transporter ATP-binding protein EcfA2